MEDLLIEILESFGFPVVLQGSLANDEPYPDNFFTWWENESRDGSHYDNEAKSEVFDYDVNFYTNDPETVYPVLRRAINALKDVNFIISGSGYTVASDESTHFGRGVNVLYRYK